LIVSRKLGYLVAVGFAAMLSESPNDFIKQRFEIAPGSAAKGWKGMVFRVCAGHAQDGKMKAIGIYPPTDNAEITS
jgi:hypothetical protein